jgi:hypothetical protein
LVVLVPQFRVKVSIAVKFVGPEMSSATIVVVPAAPAIPDPVRVQSVPAGGMITQLETIDPGSMPENVYRTLVPLIETPTPLL